MAFRAPNPRGFTLLEVLIVLAILSTISILTSQSIQQAIRSKMKLHESTDSLSRVRDALKIIERDVNLAFHYRDLDKELLELIKKKKTSGASTSTTSTLPGQPPAPPTTAPSYSCAPDSTDPLCAQNPNKVDPVTHFIGSEKEVAFVTLNSGRISEAARQADFIKVGYALRSCRKADQKETSDSCLVRRSDTVVEGDVKKGGEEIVLLEDVKEFKLRYIGKGKQDWVSDWNSKQGDASTKDNFPLAVEVSLTVESGKGEKKRKISMQLVIPIRFPNNPTREKGANPSP